MQTLKFKTNIKCSGCLAKSTPYLNEAVGEDNWEVDINNPDKVLTVAMEEDVDAARVIQAVENAGFNAERLD